MVNRSSADGEKRSRSASVRRCGVVTGSAFSALVAAAAVATGSAAPAHADFEDLLDPVIQPILTSLTDSVAVFDPTLATDLTTWTDTFLANLDTWDAAAAATGAITSGATSADVSSSAEAAASSTLPTYDIPITVAEDTEPTVQATIGDGTASTLLVDTGSSGLVVPESDLGVSNLFQLLEDYGLPTGFGESGYSGGVDYVYLTYDETVDYTSSTGTLETTDIPVEVEVYSWEPGDLASLFSNDAFQNFLSDNEVTGILGIGDGTSGAAGESPLEAAGYTYVTVDEVGANPELTVSDTASTGSLTELSASGSTVDDLTETVTTSSGQTVGTATVDDDLDSGGVYGTIPESISSSTLANGDVVKVYDGDTLLYEYTVSNNGVDNAPTAVDSDDIDSGVALFNEYPVTIDYADDGIYIG